MQLELINEPKKVNQSTIIADLEDTMLTIGKRSLIFPVIDIETTEQVGFYLSGNLYLGADTLVITKRGAIGEPTEKLSHEAFVNCKNIDLENVRSTSISDKAFRKIEIQAFRNFETMRNFRLAEKKRILDSNRLYLSHDHKQFDFFVYLFDPEPFILIKDKDLLITLSEEEQAIVICDKKKSSYVEVSKDIGVKISNNKGETIDASTTNGLIFNGRPLNEILTGAFDTLKTLFK